ncbi:MAG: hypothetical protein WBA18_06075 [Terracidiphilus sp.]
MKGIIRLVGLLALLAAIPAARAADATGTWKGSVDVNGGSMPLVFHLTVANGVVTGTIEGMPTTPAEIHDGKADADGITFSANSDYQGQTYKVVFHGKLAPAGDEIAFTVGTDDGSWSSQMTVERVSDAAPAAAPAAVDVSGTWKGAFDYNGTTMTQVFHLASANGVVTGTVEGLPTTPAEIHEGKIDGGTVTFWVNTDYQGTTYKLIYKGKVTAGQIVFTLGVDDGSWSTQMTAEKA